MTVVEVVKVSDGIVNTVLCLWLFYFDIKEQKLLGIIARKFT